MSDLATSEEMLTQSAVAQFPMGCICQGSPGILGRTTDLPSRTTKVVRYIRKMYIFSRDQQREQLGGGAIADGTTDAESARGNDP
jgi:hypothetical protein